MFKLPKRGDWENHWERHDLIRIIPEGFSWHEWLKKAAKNLNNSGMAIELGGFPGSFCIYLKKYCGLEVTLLDYIIDKKITESLLELNDLQPADIKLIEADIFSCMPYDIYDLVCSFGFIEHFTDLKQVFRNHLKFLKPGGFLLVTLPNFRGINGLLQRIFDPMNLSMHNLKAMDLMLLKNIVSSLGMEDIQVEYYPSTQVWLEGLRERSFLIRVIIRIVDTFVRLLANLFGAQSRWLSNSIVILAKNPLGNNSQTT